MRAVNEYFLMTYELQPERFASLLINVCCDGASVNMGVYNGACARMKENRVWLLVIHCANPRLELAPQDAFKKNDSFKSIYEFMREIWTTF